MKVHQLLENALIPRNAEAVMIVIAAGKIIDELERRGARVKTGLMYNWNNTQPFISFHVQKSKKFDDSVSMKPFIRELFKKSGVPYKWSIDERVKGYVVGAIVLTPNVSEIDMVAAAKAVQQKKLRIKVTDKKQ